MEPPNTEFSPLMDNFGYPIVVCVYTVSRCADSGMIQIKSGEKKIKGKKEKQTKQSKKHHCYRQQQKKKKTAAIPTEYKEERL